MEPKTGTKQYRRIATEEAFAIPEQFAGMRELGKSAIDHPDLDFWRTLTGENRFAKVVGGRLLDLQEERLQIMDEYGIAVQVLLMTSTGVQMFDADHGTAVAALSNDRLAELIGKYPHRFAGLATIAPQDPQRAAQEIDRAVTKLGLNGVVINSHTNDEYLDEPKYWPILEAAAGLDVPIYIHPRAPSVPMAAPYRKYRLEGAIWGYGAETGLHGVRLITGGVFDEFPNLKIILGHMGEGIPFWLWRFDYMHKHTSRGQRPDLKQEPSDYFKQNFMITTSGMNWDASLKFCLEVLGADNIMFAVDYPYQETAGAVEFMDNAPISEQDKENIYWRNAERLFRINA